MAKKTISKFKDDDISNALISKYGDVIKSGTEVIESLGTYDTVSVSPALDLALGGGIREGTCVDNSPALRSKMSKDGQGGSIL